MFGDVLLAGNSRVLSMANEDMTRPFFYWFPFSFGELKKGYLVLLARARQGEGRP
jgi:hypothetical protein